VSRACPELVLSKVEGRSRRVLGRVNEVEVAGLAVAVFAPVGGGQDGPELFEASDLQGFAPSALHWPCVW
jgi:hypothetical protein